MTSDQHDRRSRGRVDQVTPGEVARTGTPILPSWPMTMRLEVMDEHAGDDSRSLEKE